MKDVIGKLSTYNLYNYLLPGVIFAALADIFTSYTVLQEDIVIGFFLYYALGVVVSRIGSLVIEPPLKLLKKFPKFEYADFVVLSKDDAILEVLREVMNMFRSFSAMFGLLLVIKVYDILLKKSQLSDDWDFIIIMVLLVVLFIVAFGKQRGYVGKRIDALKGERREISR